MPSPDTMPAVSAARHLSTYAIFLVMDPRCRRTGQVEGLSALGVGLMRQPCEHVAMEASSFDELEFLAALGDQGVRALLIGRRALVALGIPVLTADYDFWLHREDIEALNAIAARFDLVPNRSPEEARSRGRYVLENDERMDVMLSRSHSTVLGEKLVFDDVWARRTVLDLHGGATLALPCIDDLIKTKQFAARARDLDDIKLLEALKKGTP